MSFYKTVLAAAKIVSLDVLDELLLDLISASVRIENLWTKEKYNERSVEAFYEFLGSCFQRFSRAGSLVSRACSTIRNTEVLPEMNRYSRSTGLDGILPLSDKHSGTA